MRPWEVPWRLLWLVRSSTDLERIAGRAVQRVRAERRDLVLVRIQHTEGGRAGSRGPRRVPHRSIGRVLELGRVRANLRLWIERKALIARIELADHRLVDRHRGIREP